MESGVLSLDKWDGGLDLQSTLESGQTYLWTREDNETYTTTDAYGGDQWYAIVIDDNVVRARQRNGHLEWESTTDAVPYLINLLRLSDNLPAIIQTTPEDPLIETAYSTYRGMRLVNDPFFPCLISFICSTQMHTQRIFQMQTALAKHFGDPVDLDGTTYHSYPEPERLADASEADLRDLKLGYRAPYVQKTAEMIAYDDFAPTDLPANYEAARTALTGLVGVGPKVADCVCLFALGHLDAVPLDTWIRTAVDEYYPDSKRDSYDEMSRAIRQRFGPYAGYTQTYLFHYLRNHPNPE